MGFFVSAISLSPLSSVGASLLAMVVNDNALNLTHRSVLRFFASKLAPAVHQFISSSVPSDPYFPALSAPVMHSAQPPQ
ncbi:hypothetical protein EMIT0P218_280005 [Pseudomonas sp. IT-P218]